VVFYTDAGAAAYVVLSTSLTLRGWRTAGAVTGALAVMFRQTNIVWVGWAAAVRLLDDLALDGVNTTGWAQGWRPLWAFLLAALPRLPRLVLFKFWAHLGALLGLWRPACKTERKRGTLRHEARRNMRPSLFPLSCPAHHPVLLACFGAFVYTNGGIVLGDKDAHKPVLHAAQLPYFAAFAVAMGVPHLLTPANLDYLVKSVGPDTLSYSRPERHE
jgi:alpha-1,2-glucosyltransferase